VIKSSEIARYTRMPEYAVDVAWTRLEAFLAELAKTDLDLDPDFQRPHVWTATQQTAYVEHVLRGGWASRTLLLNCPRWLMGGRGIVLVDGKQRLEAARSFMRDELPVFGGNRRSDFDVVDPIEASFRIAVNELPTRADVLRWYLEINAGGTPHTIDELDRVRALLAEEEVAHG
jgi:hypothetical protein